MPEKMLRVGQAARRLGVDVRTVRGWIHDGKLKAITVRGRFGAEFRISESDLAELAPGYEPQPQEAEPVIHYRQCEGTRTNGEKCGGPAMKGSRLCRHHQDQLDKLPDDLPLTESEAFDAAFDAAEAGDDA